MKRIILTVFGAAVLLAACNNEAKNETTKDSTVGTNTAMKDKEEAWVPVDSATQMKAMMDYATPGPNHQMMASWNGTWTGDIKMWMKNGGEPTTSTGTAVNSMVMNGLYQSSKHSGNMMGMPFEGVSTLGYDNAKKVFVSTWIDNMGSGIMYLSGPWDEATKSMTLTGKVTDPARNGKQCDIREVFKVIDDNTQLMEMYGPDNETGKEYKMMEIKLTRKK
jgi:hypothetical protein